MDTLSSHVPTFKIPSTLLSTPREIYHFKNPKSSHHHHLPQNPYFCYPTTTKSAASSTSSISNKNKLPLVTSHPLLPSSPSLSPKRSLPRTEPSHKKAATGYATALLDVAQGSNSLEAMNLDVKRLSKWLQNKELRGLMTDPCVEEKEKGQVMKEVAERGGFHRYLVKLVNLLVKKNRVGMLSEVLQELERIYDELSGTQLVFLPSEMKEMEFMKQKEHLLVGIANRVLKFTGAVRVKVKHCSFSSIQQLSFS